VVKAGDRITYTLVVTNTGGAPATNVVVTDSVPAFTTYVAGSAVPADKVSGPNPLKWTLGTLNPGQSATMRFVVTVDQLSTARAIRNQAYVLSSETPIVGSNIIVHAGTPTAVTLSSFTAVQAEAGMTVRWVTAVEINSFGFMVYRGTTADRDAAVAVTAQVIPAQGRDGGFVYQISDQAGSPSSTYWLREVDRAGGFEEFRPQARNRTPTLRLPSSARAPWSQAGLRWPRRRSVPSQPPTLAQIQRSCRSWPSPANRQ
jgi:uncharacterized repeat protein (TIGR01451 family)